MGIETEGKNNPKSCLLDIVIEKLIEERVFMKAISQHGEGIENELLDLSCTIRNKMGTDQNIFMRYEELSSKSENESLRSAYKQGLTDGIQLLKDILLEGKTLHGIR